VNEALAILALSALCAGWVLLQRWIGRHDPENPGIRRECDGGCAGCEDACPRERHG
jgi:hypothetical protein